jgi:hypothetical protein
MEKGDDSRAADVAEAFPRKALVIPGLIPLAILGLLFGADAVGAKLNPHGFSGVVVLLVMVYGVVAGVFEVFLIARTLPQLVRMAALRTTQNLLAILFAAVFVIVVFWFGFRIYLG